MNVNSYSCCSSTSRQSCNISELAQVLKLVAGESRLKILCILQEGEHCVCEIEKQVTLSQSLISHHLRDLKAAGIIQDEKRGLYVHYALTPEGKRITDLVFQVTKKEKGL